MSLSISIIFGSLLSAACGLRIFIPFLLLSFVTGANLISFPESWSWIGSPQTIHFLIAATIFELIASYFPVISLFYKNMTLPLALISGTFIMSFFLLDTNVVIAPLMRWTLAIIFGGTIATLFRTFSIAIDGGVPHPFKVTEEILSVGASVASIVSVMVLL